MGVYDNFKVANYPDALLSPELYARHVSRLWSGEVVDGLTVTPGTGLQVILAAGNGFIRYGSANVASARLFSLVDTFALAIPTPDGSNPRIDLVVIYIDNDEDLPVTDPPTSANLDGLGVVKAKIVSGTANASPVAPNGAAIQSSVGASNQYIIAAQVRTDAGVSVIASNKITDVRDMASVSAVRLASTESTDVQNGTSLTANTWTDAIPNKSFTVGSEDSTIEIDVSGSMQILSSSSTFGSSRLVIDSSGSPQATQNIKYGGGPITSSIGCNPITGGSKVSVGSLSAGTHTVKLQVLCGATGSMYLRASSQPNQEFMTTTVVESK